MAGDDDDRLRRYRYARPLLCFPRRRYGAALQLRLLEVQQQRRQAAEIVKLRVGSWQLEAKGDGMGSQIDRYLDWKMPFLKLGQILIGAVSLGAVAMAQSGPLVLEREGRVISLEPYAPNILRVTMSLIRPQPTGGPGYGFVAQPSARDGRTSATRKATTYSARAEWLCACRPRTFPRRNYRSRCRSMR